ncbi:MAG: hypothetical protein WC637_06620 [Victivallales bacterium]|jgi:DnaJ-class molecular chaperone
MKILKLFLMFVALLFVAGAPYSKAESDDEGDYEELRSSHSESDSGQTPKKNVKIKEQSKGSSIAQESKMKKYNSSSVWTERKCDRCNGTGSVPTAIYDNKKNSVVKIMLACPKCKGRGYEGMTKDN